MTNFTEQDIIKVLSDVKDPDLGKSLGELNAVQKVTIDDEIIKVWLELPGPIAWVAKTVNDECAAAIEKLTGGHPNEIMFAERNPDIGDRNVLTQVKNIIAVASGKGGVGKSAIASNIAAALYKQGAKVGVLDADITGPSQPTMFGVAGQAFEAEETKDGKTIAYPVESHGIKVASMGFMLDRDDAAILRGPLLSGYFSLMFEQIEWGELDFLVLDLPPGTGDIQLTMTQKLPLTGAVVVTTPQEISVADVRRAIAMFRKVNVDIFGIVENMAYFTPDDMPDKKYYIFGKDGGKNVAKENGITFLGEVPLNINMREANDGGTPIVLADDSSLQTKTLMEVTANMVKEVRKVNFKKLEAGNVEISI
jgi:ATP-binding protein involved in chromosome partitioning